MLSSPKDLIRFGYHMPPGQDAIVTIIEIGRGIHSEYVANGDVLLHLGVLRIHIPAPVEVEFDKAGSRHSMLIVVARWVEHMVDISRCFRLGVVTKFVGLQESTILHLEAHLDKICASIAILACSQGTKNGPAGAGEVGKRIDEIIDQEILVLQTCGRQL